MKRRNFIQALGILGAITLLPLKLKAATKTKPIVPTSTFPVLDFNLKADFSGIRMTASHVDELFHRMERHNRRVSEIHMSRDLLTEGGLAPLLYGGQFVSEPNELYLWGARVKIYDVESRKLFLFSIPEERYEERDRYIADNLNMFRGKPFTFYHVM